MPYIGMPVLRDDQLYAANQPPIPVDTPAWFAWLAEATHFCYQPATSIYRLTLRKEKRRHRFYWYAYLKNARKLHNAYVGRTETVTRERLQKVHQRLMKRVVQQKEMARNDQH